MIALMLSAAALLTSVSVAMFNVYVWRAKKADDARKAFEEAILGIMNAKRDYEALRREAANDFDSPEMMGRRVTIVDTRNFNLAKAQQAFAAAKFATSSADNLLLASALIDSGRRGASVPFYERAVRLAADPYDRASASRVLGRAQILSGEHKVGRETMLEAAELYTELAGDPGYETHRMFDEVAETHRRLIDSQLDVNVRDHLEEDLAALETAIGRMSGGRADAMRKIAADIRIVHLGSEAKA